MKITILKTKQAKIIERKQQTLTINLYVTNFIILK